MNLQKYPGQKEIPGVFHKIINEIPKHTNYYELFAGSGAIAKLLMKKATANYHLNDIDFNVTRELSKTYPNAAVTNLDIQQVLKTLAGILDKNCFIFLDPPYKHETRPGNQELYQHEMTDDQHIQLLLAVLQQKSKIMIIHPKCELYDTVLKGWRTVPVKIRYHTKTSLELLYMNYPEPDELQTDFYLGKDCWDRQRLKRKADGWVKKIQNLPVLERKMLMNRLAKVAHQREFCKAKC